MIIMLLVHLVCVEEGGWACSRLQQVEQKRPLPSGLCSEALLLDACMCLYM